MKTVRSDGPGRCVLGWGVAARLSASTEDLLQRLLRAMPTGFRATLGPGRGRRFAVRRVGRNLEFAVGGQIRFLGRTKRGFASAVADALETLASTDSRRFAFIHAGGVAIDGRAILLPGRSHSGKSTLVEAFLRRGALYLSDDMTPVDGRLRAHPFPRPLGIRPKAGGMPQRTPIARLGARPADRAIPVALVWCGSFDPLAARPTFKLRQGLAAFAELLPHAPGAQIRPEVVIPIFTRIAAHVPVYSGVRGEAGQMVDTILRRLDTLHRP